MAGKCSEIQISGRHRTETQSDGGHFFHFEAQADSSFELLEDTEMAPNAKTIFR